MRIRSLLGTVALCSALALLVVPAGGAGARSLRTRTIRILATSPSTFSGTLIKPGVLEFNNSLQGRTTDFAWGPGETRREFAYGPNVGIVWTRWGARAAGRASFWIGYSTVCHGCRYIREEVKLAAWRVRRGHYTRLSITFPRGPVVYALDRIRVPAKGFPRGILAYAWCDTQQPTRCVSP